MADIIFAGFGGQGILTVGKILITIAAKEGKNITWISSYGAEMRGGTANCSVIISDEEIGTPYPDKLDVLIAMSGGGYDKFINDVREGGYVIVNTSLVKDKEYPKDINVMEVDASNLAASIDNSRGANLAMLGAFIKGTEMFDKDIFGDELEKYFTDKGINSPKNKECYKLGFENASKI